MDILTNIIMSLNHEVNLMSLTMLMLAGISVVVASGFQLYMKIRPRFPIRVNCWFCNTNTDVTFSKRNSWDCPNCEQYNGFSQDGDYNKIISSQSDELLNHPVIAVKRSPFKTDDNGLCRKCNINQELKVQQLASFIPIDNAHFEEEVELYRERLERAYQLCEQCDSKTNRKLALIKAKIQNMYNLQANKIKNFANGSKLNPRKEKFVYCVNTVFCAMSILAGMVACVALLARLQPLLQVEVTPELQLLLAESLKWETYVELTATLIMVCCLLLRSSWLAAELLPTTMWGLATYCNYESQQSDPLFNCQHLANAQSAFIPAAFLTTIWCHVKYYKVIPTPDVPKPTIVSNADLKTKDRCELASEDLHEQNETPTENSTWSTSNQSSLLNEAAFLSSPKLCPLDLQSSLNDLSLGPLLQAKIPTPPLFETRTYQTPNLPDFINSSKEPSCEDDLESLWKPRKRKPVLSPARLKLNSVTHSSWVAGGYWQQNSVFPSTPSMYNPLPSFPSSNFPLSRSSSQSSGFASQGGTNYSSLPNSRTGSVCEADRFSVLSEPIYPSYTPPSAPYCCYVATPHPAAFYFSPIPSTPSPTTAFPTPDEYANKEVEKRRFASHISDKNTDNKAKSFLGLVKENFFLATLFFSSIVFNIVVIAFAAVNTIKAHS